MNFAPPPRPRAPAENIVPMINVVFLLLIFFLMSAQIAPPPPAQITPPQSRQETAPEAEETLYLAADGTVYFGAQTGDAALAAIAMGGLHRIRLAADRTADLARLADLSGRLRAAGITRIDLVTERR